MINENHPIVPGHRRALPVNSSWLFSLSTIVCNVTPSRYIFLASTDRLWLWRLCLWVFTNIFVVDTGNRKELELENYRLDNNYIRWFVYTVPVFLSNATYRIPKKYIFCHHTITKLLKGYWWKLKNYWPLGKSIFANSSLNLPHRGALHQHIACLSTRQVNTTHFAFQIMQ